MKEEEIIGLELQNKIRKSITQAKKEDYIDLRNIFLKTRQEEFYWVNKESLRLEDFDISTEGEIILVAKIKDENVGFISIWEEDKFIHNLFVSTKHKSCGVGQALIRECKDIIGLPLTLKCVSKNKKALGFYLLQGFEIIEEVFDDEPYYLMKLS